MNDRGIRRTFPLYAQIFEFLVQTPIFKEIRRAIYIDERSTFDERSTLTSDLHVDRSQGGFWLFTG